MASCILHVGTHKTGTTAIQFALASGDGWLERAGLVYPRGCRYYDGHHHLAFQLLESSKYDPAQGDLDALLDEIVQTAERTSVVSSEALHFLADRPDAMRVLAAGLAARRIATRIVLYVRERPSYVESLYAQLLRHGLCLTFGDFARAIEEDGSFRYDPLRRYDLAYARVADAFAETFGRENVIVRPYRFGASADAIMRDFLDAIGVPEATIADPAEARYNVTASLREIVQRWSANLAPRNHVPSLDAVARSLFGERATALLDAPFRAFDRDDATAFSARFAGDDDALWERYVVRLDPIARSAEAPRVADLFEAMR